MFITAHSRQERGSCEECAHYHGNPVPLALGTPPLWSGRQPGARGLPKGPGQAKKELGRGAQAGQAQG